jgi:hypothetical protein
MVKLRTLFEVISTAKSEAEAQTLFDEAHKAMPDNTIGHSVPVYYLDGRTADMMVRFPDGHEEKSGKTYPGLIQHIGE